MAGIWTAAIGMLEQPGRGTAASTSHLQRVRSQRGIDPTPHGPPHDLPRRAVEQGGSRQPALARPAIRHSAHPGVIRLVDVTLTRQQIRCHVLPVSALGGDGTATRGPFHAHLGVLHQPFGLSPSHCTSLILEGFGHATRAITVTGVAGNRLDTGYHRDCLHLDREVRWPRPRPIQPTAAHVQRRTLHRDGPGCLVRSDTGVPQCDSLAKEPRAFCNTSRSIRRRFPAWRS